MQDELKLTGGNQSAGIGSLEKHWDNKLTSCKSHPYPLAPVDMVQCGAVTPENYSLENRSFGQFCSLHMANELKFMVSDVSIRNVELRPVIEIFGPGLARDLDWIRDAVGLGFCFKIHDISAIALQYVAAKFSDLVERNVVELAVGEIEDRWAKQRGLKNTSVFYASQFIQVLNRQKMGRVMRHLGVLLSGKSSHHGRRLYLMHPFWDDNRGSRIWNGISLPSVVWGDTTPYNELTLVKALQDGSDRRVSVSVLGKHHYYHQTYSFLRVSVE